MLELGQVEEAQAVGLRAVAVGPKEKDAMQLLRRARSAVRAMIRDPLPNPLPEYLGDAAVYYDMGSARTMVWFGGIHEPFLSTALLTKYNLNGLFLRDLKSDWYTSGLKGIADDHESSVAWLGDFLLAKDTFDVAFAGQSSGGYAALRYSHALSPNVCIDFAPQTHNRVNAKGEKQPWVDVASLNVLYEQQPQPNTPIILHLARSEDKNPADFRWEDWEQIAALQKLENVTIVRHAFDQHAISLCLYERGVFYDMLDRDFHIYGRNSRWIAPL